MTADSADSGVPSWLRRVTENLPADPAGVNPIVERFAPVGADARQAAVLILFGGSPEADPDARGGLPADADVLLTQRASTLRQHGGQVAFPGGGADDGDDGPIGTALREATEETGLVASGVQPLAVLPGIYVPPSRFDVTPVVGYWRTPSPVQVVDEAEAARVVRVPISDLIDPANRFLVKHPIGYIGPAFAVEGMVVWGFTGGILAGLLAISGWEYEWDYNDVRDLEETLTQVGEAFRIPPAPESASLRGADE